jgi:hypothetical protein
VPVPVLVEDETVPGIEVVEEVSSGTDFDQLLADVNLETTFKVS